MLQESRHRVLTMMYLVDWQGRQYQQPTHVLAIYEIGQSIDDGPTLEPILEPTSEPKLEPTSEPTSEPTLEPTSEPTSEPILEPTEKNQTDDDHLDTSLDETSPTHANEPTTAATRADNFIENF